MAPPSAPMPRRRSALSSCRGLNFAPRPGVGHPPNSAGDVVGDEEGAVLGQRDGGRTPPHLGALAPGNPKARHEILITADGATVLEGHAHDLVAGRCRAVPRTFEDDEGAAAIVGRELVARVKD